MRKLTLLALFLAAMVGSTARANEPAHYEPAEGTPFSHGAVFVAAVGQLNGGETIGVEAGLCLEAGKHLQFTAKVCAGGTFDSHHMAGGVLSVAFYRAWKRVWLGGGALVGLEFPTIHEDKPAAGLHHGPLLSGAITINLVVPLHKHFHIKADVGAGVVGPAMPDRLGHNVGPLGIAIVGIVVPFGGGH